MRVALLQPELDVRMRAANLQSLVRAIGRAAQQEPAPDLVILPGGCDTGGVAADRGYPAALRQGFREAIAHQAREWGVYIAAGLHHSPANGSEVGALLFDPDGDLVALTALGAARGEEPVPQVALYTSPVGTLGVSLGVIIELSDAPEPAEPGAPIAPAPTGALIAVPIATTTTARKTRADERFVAALLGREDARVGAYWAVVCPAGAPAAPWSTGTAATFICGPDGRVIAEATGLNETMVLADLDLELASAGAA